MNEPNQDPNNETPKGILDAVSFSQQSSTMRTLNPQSLVLEVLAKLKPREREVLIKRYGLEDGNPETLERIGQKLNLTRERIRQIEREGLKKLNMLEPPAEFASAADLVYQIIEEHGEILSEKLLLQTVLLNKETAANKMAVLFILQSVPRFSEFPESPSYHRGWFVNGFDKELFEKVISQVQQIFTDQKKPLRSDKLLQEIRRNLAGSEVEKLSNEALEGYIALSQHLGRSPFEEWGLAEWAEIRPKDVGDKAYLILTHHGKPEHYSTITELINKTGFDKRTAHKETVHNELIKDKRFVLIGRGIYALREWGYKDGDVADIIAEILRESHTPLSRDEIIERVLKQRMVKKNTIVFGLLNKDRFTKTTDNKYTITEKA